MMREAKAEIIRTGVGALIYICALIAVRRYQVNTNVEVILFLAAYLIMAYGMIKQIKENIWKGHVFDENLLMILATTGAFVIGRYDEGVAVVLFFQLGNICEKTAVGRSKKTIEGILDIRPSYANIKEDGEERQIAPEELKCNDIIVVRPGERVPVDGMIVKGNTSVDSQAVTGEAMPDESGCGDMVYSGSINMTGAVEVRVMKTFEDSTVSKVLHMVEEAEEKKAESERFITKFARVYTPFILICAILLAVIMPLTFAKGQWMTWIYRGLIFIVVACPCGLAVSVPIAFFGGIHAAARRGIVIKGGNFLETLSKADTFVFDKTGTLTQGEFEVQDVKAYGGYSVEEILQMAAHIESYSNHPLAQCLTQAYDGPIYKDRVHHLNEIPGCGMSAVYQGRMIYIGNARMMDMKGIEFEEVEASGTVVYVAVERQYAGYVAVADILKEDACDTMHYLKKKYQATLVMLTGDTNISGAKAGQELEMDSVYTNMLPEDKIAVIEEMLEVQNDSEKLVYVGDGINDAPVLARVDVGIAMGALGSDAAIEAADIVLMEDETYGIVEALKISRETMKIVKQNIAFALAVKVIVLGLSAFGFVSMWEAVLADMIVMLLAVINAVWVARYPA